MGCCSPNSHEQVNEQEEKVNANGNNTVPVWVKIAQCYSCHYGDQLPNLVNETSIL